MSTPKFKRLLEPGIPARTPKARRRADGVSAGKARTQRNNAMLASGRHPVSGRRLLAVTDTAAPTCGDCVHHFTNRRSKTYHKCDLNATGGAATDIRVSWPACTEFVAAPVEGQQTP